MYKQLNIHDLMQINTNFFIHLHRLYQKHKFSFFKAFLEHYLKESERVYFFEKNTPIFRIQKVKGGYRFVDEKEKIDLRTDQEGVSLMHNFMKDKYGLYRQQKKNRTLLEQLLYQFQEGEYNEILGKPFIVYDVETTYTGEQIHDQCFEIAYSVGSYKDHQGAIQYDFIDYQNIKQYVDDLLLFDGRIVGYNNVAFDNPVIIRHVGYSDDELDILNKKSFDIFVFLHALLGKRLKLGIVAQALVTSGKTLSSGSEGSALLQKRKKEGDQNAFKKVKEYCKNDVQITLGVLLSLMKYKKINIEGKTYVFDIDQMINLGSYLDDNLSKYVSTRALL